MVVPTMAAFRNDRPFKRQRASSDALEVLGAVQGIRHVDECVLALVKVVEGEELYAGATVLAEPLGHDAGVVQAVVEVGNDGPVFKSVTKLPTNKITGGVPLNQKVTPTMLTGEQNWLQDLCPLEYAAPGVDVYETCTRSVTVVR
ncbi:MAG: hypothetical protein IKE22_04900 [Atopobiaceae bacterium]|nr:hypothetical protein [Atopobiaceae bacterium]